MTLSTLFAKVAHEAKNYRESKHGARWVIGIGRSNYARTYLLRRLNAFWEFDLGLSKSPESLLEIAGAFLQGTKFEDLAAMNAEDVRSALKQ